jgi:LPS-assembly lipoprotein
MWSFDGPVRGRGLSLLCLLAVSGCFQPLYGGGSGSKVVSDMASINVVPVPDRLGYYLTKELTFAFRGGGEAPPPRYNLTITVHERVTTPLIDTVSGRASAAILGVDAEYRLTENKTSKVLASGTAFTMESYDRSSQRYANIRAARDAEIRGAQVLADQIKTRLAAELAAGD